MTTKTVAIVSGGMDSVAMAHLLTDIGHDLSIVTFDYGQRHNREIGFAQEAAERLGAPWTLVDLTTITAGLSGSALTDRSVPVPEGHYTAPTMRTTVVPNRNMMMISVAAALAVARGAHHVAVGVHSGDHAIYPDCRPEFVDAMTDTLKIATDGFSVDGFAVLAPFVHATKTDIARAGDELGVPWAKTWSCYRGGPIHCGRCGTCVERREAFELAQVEDPTSYEDDPVAA